MQYLYTENIKTLLREILKIKYVKRYTIHKCELGKKSVLAIKISTVSKVICERRERGRIETLDDEEGTQLLGCDSDQLKPRWLGE